MAVYFIRCGDYVKIGVSGDVEQRLKNLQGSNPYKLELVHVIEGGTVREKFFHQRFQDFRVSGEWFEYEPVMAALKELGWLDVDEIEAGPTYILGIERANRSMVVGFYYLAKAVEKLKPEVVVEVLGMTVQDVAQDYWGALRKGLNIGWEYDEDGYYFSVLLTTNGSRYEFLVNASPDEVRKHSTEEIDGMLLVMSAEQLHLVGELVLEDELRALWEWESREYPNEQYVSEEEFSHWRGPWYSNLRAY